MIVSHDRQFIDNVATECYMFEGDGIVNKYVGGFFDAKQQQTNYFAQKAQQEEAKQKKSLQKTESAVNFQPVLESQPKNRPIKLSYKEQRELEQLPQILEQLENEITALQTEIGSTEFFQQPHEYTAAKLQLLADKEQLMESTFLRWEELEEKKADTS